ncbi:hypothetical protein R0J91_13250, partial [Micrococcus sp. SIMBA_131]
FNSNSLMIDSMHKSDLEYFKSFLGRMNPWMNRAGYKGVKDAIAERIQKSNLYVNKDSNTLDIENSTNWDKFAKYKKQMFEAKVSRKKQGF